MWQSSSSRPSSDACACAPPIARRSIRKQPTSSEHARRGAAAALDARRVMVPWSEVADSSSSISEREQTDEVPAAEPHGAVPEETSADELSIPNPPVAPGPILTLSPEEISRF